MAKAQSYEITTSYSNKSFGLQCDSWLFLPSNFLEYCEAHKRYDIIIQKKAPMIVITCILTKNKSAINIY